MNIYNIYIHIYVYVYVCISHLFYFEFGRLNLRA